MFCTTCGQELPDGTLFCTNCGARLNVADAAAFGSSPSQGYQQPPMQGQSVPYGYASGAPAASAPGMSAMPPAAPAQKKEAFVPALIGVVAGIVVVAILAVGIFLFGWFGISSRFVGGATTATSPGAASSATASASAQASKATIPDSEKTPATVTVKQVDNKSFPQVTFFASVVDGNGGVIEGLTTDDFTVQESSDQQTASTVILNEVSQVQKADHVSVDLVLDSSGSMNSSNKMSQAKKAANAFIGEVNLSGGDKIEITSFNDYVYMNSDFTGDASTLATAIGNISPTGDTALYDALYSAIAQTYKADGARCVIAFTDGLENASNYSYNDVVSAATSTGIPVYIVGIGTGSEYDASTLRALAQACNGEFYAASSSDLETSLKNIYTDLYQQERGYYRFVYTSSDATTTTANRTIAVSSSATSRYKYSATRAYVTTASINANFANDYRDVDYIISDSSSRRLGSSDLTGLSLAQLRIARNEIFARHGRQFKDAMLNKWFYSKAWYLSIEPKYSPDAFDAMSSPLSDLETDNVNMILGYEKDRMASQDIYPNASTVVLSEYDLALSKEVLNTALSQMQRYQSTTILQQNIEAVKAKIATADVSY